MMIEGCYAYTGGKPFDAHRPCIVFLHGAVNDHSVWGLQARAFAHRGYSVLALDLPGHGKSKGKPLASIEETGQWLLAWLHAAGVQTAALVGHSMGSLIALEAAAQSTQPHTNSPSLATTTFPVISTLVMVGTTYPMRVSPQLLDLAERDPLEAVENVAAWSIYGLAPKPCAPGPGTWLYGASRALMRRIIALADPSINLFAHDFRLCNSYANGAMAAQALGAAIPGQSTVIQAHLIVGSKDQMTPARSVASLAESLGAKVTTLSCGHSLMTESPTELTSALQNAMAG
jgi:pimeloyl-ACP methyl ester carboxylesterase